MAFGGWSNGDLLGCGIGRWEIDSRFLPASLFRMRAAARPLAQGRRARPLARPCGRGLALLRGLLSFGLVLFGRLLLLAFVLVFFAAPVAHGGIPSC